MRKNAPSTTTSNGSVEPEANQSEAQAPRPTPRQRELETARIIAEALPEAARAVMQDITIAKEHESARAIMARATAFGIMVDKLRALTTRPGQVNRFGSEPDEDALGDQQRADELATKRQADDVIRRITKKYKFVN